MEGQRDTQREAQAEARAAGGKPARGQGRSPRSRAVFRSEASFRWLPSSSSATVPCPGIRPRYRHTAPLLPAAACDWALHQVSPGTENRSAWVTPTLLRPLLPRDRPLTYPACGSAPRCSQALEETAEMMPPVTPATWNAPRVGGHPQRRSQPGLNPAPWELPAP